MKNFFKKNFFKFVFVAVGLGFVIFLNPRDFFSPAREVFYLFFYPFEKSASFFSWKIADVKNVIFSINDLKKENEMLHEENLKLTAENIALREARKENEILRQELDLSVKVDLETESGEILNRVFSADGEYAIIDKGKRNGIASGMPVIVGGGIMVGKVEDVFENSARVIFLTHPQSAIGAVTDENETKGIVKGDYGISIVMDMIPENDLISKGDKVVTLGGEKISRRLFLGTVEEVMASSDPLFKKAIISSPVDLNKLRFVFVVKNSDYEK